MSEIKFRIWDFNNKKIIYEPTFDDVLKYCSSKVPMNEMLSTTFNKMPIFSQYTGIIDKNGKEIYVGDIINYKSGDSWYKHTITDIYDLFICYIYIDIDRMNHSYENYEIIGNIYENKE